MKYIKTFGFTLLIIFVLLTIIDAKTFLDLAKTITCGLFGIYIAVSLGDD